MIRSRISSATGRFSIKSLAPFPALTQIGIVEFEPGTTALTILCSTPKSRMSLFKADARVHHVKLSHAKRRATLFLTILHRTR